ncbi:MAG TPA: Cu(I)-responsive transcriptional regulator [Halieaceae bacterium]|nr:Cu(I)-responsive transcriptional regulator [Halieaceae bacterium]
MKIAEAARQSGLSAKAIRYYESIGLVAAPARADNGYRDYPPEAVDELGFVQRARAVGFSVDECRQLLALYRDPARQSAHARGLVLEKLAALDERLAQLHSMRDSLADLAGRCRGDEGPECAILDDLAQGGLNHG